MKKSILLTLSLCGLAHADVAYDNFGPNTSFTGNGYLVYGGSVGGLWWTHAFPVTPTASGEITTITVALQYLGGSPNNFTFELRADNAGSPGASLGTLGSTGGFVNFGDPAVQFNANPGITITSGTPYWVYARGDAGVNSQATWRSSPVTTGGYRAYSWDGGASFTVAALGSSNSQGAIRIEVTPSGGGGCYPNCDNSTVAPILNVQDFGCFLNRFASGDTYANCDNSTVAPVLNVQDFGCFLNRFATGCS